MGANTVLVETGEGKKPTGARAAAVNDSAGRFRARAPRRRSIDQRGFFGRSRLLSRPFLSRHFVLDL
jgi:hypothetical protein